MKKDDFPVRRVSMALLALLLSAGAQAQTDAPEVTGTDAAALGLSDYRHFVLYPRLEKALRAQKNGDEATALREFEYIHKQVPDNVPLTLYLAEAYRHFGHDDRGRQLLREALAHAPGDARLQRNLAAIPSPAVPVTTVAQLLALQKQCDAAPSPACRSEIGQHALRLERLDIARQQLDDRAYAATPQGQALSNDLLQRAIYLKQWPLADALFSQAQRQGTLSEKGQRQWFDVLLAGQRDDSMQALQAQGLFSTPEDKIAWANALAARGEKTRLQHYLANSAPAFRNAAQERSWLYLRSRYSEHPQEDLRGYTAAFAENRRYVAQMALPAMLRAGDFSRAQALLGQFPDDALLDQLTWQLVEGGQPRDAANLLMQHYPFQGNNPTSRALMSRLAGLLQAHPQWATAEQRARFAQPLPSPALRQLQSQLPGIAENCQTVRQLFADLSPGYDAATWRLLAQCWRDDLPGMALYAYQQAEARQPDDWQHRSVAYQAYQVQDYATALLAWKKQPLTALNDEDLLAAANTAQAAGDAAARDRWLAQAQQRGLDSSANYWWLYAQRFIPVQPDEALAALTRAISIQPSVNAYSARAAIYRMQGHLPAAIDDLHSALTMEPNNSVTQATLGYALWDSGDIAASREMLTRAQRGLPDDPALIKQLAYVNQRLNDVAGTQFYAQQVVDDLDAQAQVTPLTEEQIQQRFNFRRLHEDVARRWSISFDSSVGMRSGAMSSANNGIGGAAPGHAYRSYAQLEAEYRIGRNLVLDGDVLSAYSRVFADTGGSTVMMPVKNPMSGTGVRWKPLRETVFFLAVEQQFPLDRPHGESDTLLRASASFFNSGAYSDEWHPNGPGWLAQNLYLDAAHYVRQDVQAWTADYRVSRHQKVAQGQTVEPYVHLQQNGYRDGSSQGVLVGGVGVRWNLWLGETHYDAWPHKVSLGVEYQRSIKTFNRPASADERNNAFFTVGVHW